MIFFNSQANSTIHRMTIADAFIMSRSSLSMSMAPVEAQNNFKIDVDTIGPSDPL